MQDEICQASVAIDLSRVKPANPFAEIAMRRVLSVGRELDLLEGLRRTAENKTLDKNIIPLQAVGLGIDPTLAETQMLENFRLFKKVEITDGIILLKYSTSDEVFSYGIERLKQAANTDEINIVKLLCDCTKKPVPKNDLDQALAFEETFREGLLKFLLDSNILHEFSHKGIAYVVSSRIYKNPDKFKEAMEILKDHKFGGLLDFLEENPGNPVSVVQQYLEIDGKILQLLAQSGIIDPIRLNVKGDTKDYLYRADLLTNRSDKDNFDLVRETLSNFRFGEYYSTKTRLKDLDRFFEYMLDHGYAGNAEAIGTDYHNLELKGVFRIENSGSGKFRFWVLKKDVIKDARSILRGSIPIQSNFQAGNLSTIEGVVQARSTIGVQLDSMALSRIAEALRQIHEGSAT